ncbi:MAG: hypothetical protein HY000_14585 [Planctomycetes bacterium]|nr:hypothetical protein [Planctomycetota bacterium]
MTLLLSETLAELIPPDSAYIAEYKSRVTRAIRAFAVEPGAFDLANLRTDGPVPNAMLAFYGGDVRPMMEQYAQAIDPHIPRSPLSPRRGKPKLGIVVTAFSEGVFARCWGGIAERLSRDLLDVDSYLSCGQVEPPDAPAHYTERLVMLKNLPVYFARHGQLVGWLWAAYNHGFQTETSSGQAGHPSAAQPRLPPTSNH